jgi:hypothetical protein
VTIPAPSPLLRSPGLTTHVDDRHEEHCMAQITPEPLYDHDLARRAIEFLHTSNRRLFPFTEKMDAMQITAFKRDLREGLGEALDSGSARKTSATGYITGARRLGEIVQEWRAAGGSWPPGADPDAIATELAALPDVEDEDDVELAPALVEDEMDSWRGWR